MRYCLLFFLFYTTIGIAQDNSIRVKRETIGSCGTSSLKGSLKVQSTIGQASIVSNETESDYLQLSQGFQKAIFRKKGIDDWEIVAFPNPNNGTFNFTTTLAADEKINFEILDIQGKLIYTNSGLGGETISVNLNTTADGLYFLKVKTRYTSSTIKIEIFQ